MSNSNRATAKQTINFTAGETKRLMVGGAFYKIISATGAVDVTRDNGSRIVGVLPGQGERTEFGYLTITDASGASNAVVILIGEDTFIDDRPVVTLPVVAMTHTAPAVTNASGQLLAARASRQFLFIQNNGAGDIYVRLDGAAATVGTGVKVAAGGGTFGLDSIMPSGAVTAIGTIANNPNVVVVEG